MEGRVHAGEDDATGRSGDGPVGWTSAGLAPPGRVLVVRLGPGQDLLGGLTDALDRAGLARGILLGGVASLTRMTVRTIVRFPQQPPITPADRVVTTVEGPLELMSLQGNVVPDEAGATVVHAHVVASLGSPVATEVRGGHLVEGTVVATTAELAIAELLDPTLLRRFDPATRAAEIAVGPWPPAG